MYGFLYSDYEERCYAWESVIMLRKLSMVAVVVFLSAVSVEVRHTVHNLFPSRSTVVCVVVQNLHRRALPCPAGPAAGVSGGHPAGAGSPGGCAAALPGGCAVALPGTACLHWAAHLVQR